MEFVPEPFGLASHAFFRWLQSRMVERDDERDVDVVSDVHARAQSDGAGGYPDVLILFTERRQTGVTCLPRRLEACLYPLRTNCAPGWREQEYLAGKHKNVRPIAKSMLIYHKKNLGFVLANGQLYCIELVRGAGWFILSIVNGDPSLWNKSVAAVAALRFHLFGLQPKKSEIPPRPTRDGDRFQLL